MKRDKTTLAGTIAKFTTSGKKIHKTVSILADVFVAFRFNDSDVAAIIEILK